MYVAKKSDKAEIDYVFNMKLRNVVKYGIKVDHHRKQRRTPTHHQRSSTAEVSKIIVGDDIEVNFKKFHR